MTKFLRVYAEHPDPAVIIEAAESIRNGGLVAFPTETVYGLGANALDVQAVGRIFTAKGRPATDPLIVHLSGLDQITRVARHIYAGMRWLDRQRQRQGNSGNCQPGE